MNKPTKEITGKDVEKFISDVPWIKKDKPTKEECTCNEDSGKCKVCCPGCGNYNDECNCEPETTLNTILKEADKEFDEEFYCPFLIKDADKRKEIIDMIIKAEKYSKGGTKLLTTAEKAKDFIHSQITKAYKAGQEDMEARLKHLY